MFEIGDLLAESVKRAAEKIGKGAEDFAMQNKGMTFPGHSARGLPGSLNDGDTLFAGFDLAMLAVAALLAIGAWRAGRPVKAPVSRRVTEMAHV